jgi:membrane-bound metal-dependent hydrolase YbcI (DUF457 family)
VQTYTHLAIGAFVGTLLYPHQPLMELAVAAGAIAPDLVMVPQFIFDKMSGREPLAKQSPILKILLGPSHSIPTWAGLAAIGFYFSPLLWAFAIGGLFCHIAIDLFTHGDPRLNFQDPPYLWPLPNTIHIGRWDYRIENGRLWPLKPFEQDVLACFGVMAPVLFFFQGL